jgi:hypothetical protein
MLHLQSTTAFKPSQTPYRCLPQTDHSPSPHRKDSSPKLASYRTCQKPRRSCHSSPHSPGPAPWTAPNLACSSLRSPLASRSPRNAYRWCSPRRRPRRSARARTAARGHTPRSAAPRSARAPPANPRARSRSRDSGDAAPSAGSPRRHPPPRRPAAARTSTLAPRGLGVRSGRGGRLGQRGPGASAPRRRRWQYRSRHRKRRRCGRRSRRKNCWPCFVSGHATGAATAGCLPLARHWASACGKISFVYHAFIGSMVRFSDVESMKRTTKPDASRYFPNVRLYLLVSAALAGGKTIGRGIISGLRTRRVRRGGPPGR